MSSENPGPEPSDRQALLRIDDHPAALAITARLIADARRSLCLRSLRLESWLLDAPDVLAALRGLATSGRDVQIRLLMHELTPPRDAPERLLTLAQRLPSVFWFRLIDDPAYHEDRSALILNDVGGYFLRPQGDTVEGSACLQDRARARQLAHAFEDAWERARPVTEYRALGL
ncbi:hypothetical protein [Thermomonas hydrothermalis]|uniref:DUF7931 domain-containing protein n=1 Tax=Thermomonas hydrothermalis TaxID=213588 RepID=A0A1M4T8R7_9GAMM|nr:hypothetical protein [Thermomonas hydrothermalis]SHE40861.1 hypothetical protein SAMN02745204_00388 [Thermomonas hydrothermalis]